MTQEARLRAGRSRLLKSVPFLFLATAALHCADSSRGDGDDDPFSRPDDAGDGVAPSDAGTSFDGAPLDDGGDTATSDGSLPSVLPALREWKPDYRAPFAWSTQTRIVAPGTLTNEARTFAEDLAFATNGTLPQVVAGTLATAVVGDIVLDDGANDPSLAEEGYRVEIGRILRIKANSSTGVFWGTRTTLQLLRQSLTLSSGVVRDWPQYPIRSVLFDTGNPARHFPLAWWFNQIRDLSYLKIGEVMFYANNVAFSVDEHKALDAMARRYHVHLVPQVNMPGHLDASSDAPLPASYTLVDRFGVRVNGALDLTNPDAVQWAEQQALRYVDLFSGTIWHVGGDEYPRVGSNVGDVAAYPALANYAKSQYGSNGTPKDVYHAFLNRIGDLVGAHGKTSVRIWNDMLFPSTDIVALNKNLTIEWWEQYDGRLKPAEAAAAGNSLVNCNQKYLYYNEGDSHFYNATPKGIWEDFDPAIFPRDLTLPGGATDPHLLGIKLAQWTVKPVGQRQEQGQLERVMGPLYRAFAQRGWGSDKPYPTWAQVTGTVDAIGRAPGFIDTPATGDPGAQALAGSKGITFGGAVHAFRVMGDGSVVHDWSDGSLHTEVVAPAGTATGEPMAYPFLGKQQHIFVRGQDTHLRHFVTNKVSGGWISEDWTSSAVQSGAPLLTMSGDPAGFPYGGEQHVFARGDDGHLRHWWYASSDEKVHADDWGGGLTGTPMAFGWGVTKNVFARGDDGTLWHWWEQGSEPGRVHRVSWGGKLPADATPTGFGYADSELHVFARATNDHLQHFWYGADGQVHLDDWTVHAPQTLVAGNPVSFVSGAQQHAFFRDAATSDLVQILWSPGGGFTLENWTTLAQGTPVKPAADPFGHDAKDRQHLFARDATGRLQHWFYATSDNAIHREPWY